MTTLRNEEWSIELAPEFGGSVRSLRWRGRDILRPGPDHPADTDWDARNYAAFPMVPHVGRITNGRLHWQSEDIQLPANMPPEPHAIHGFGWQSPWAVAESSPRRIVLEHLHPGGAWPWPYRATQTFELDGACVQLELGVTNLGDTSMPAGLGWHPYFPREGASLRVDTRRVWHTAAPEGATWSEPASGRFDLRNQKLVAGLDMDHAFSIGPGAFELALRDVDLTLDYGTTARAAIIYVPAGTDFFCAEPATQIPDAVNLELDSRETGLRILESGATLTLELKLTARSR